MILSAKLAVSGTSQLGSSEARFVSCISLSIGDVDFFRRTDSGGSGGGPGGEPHFEKIEHRFTLCD